MDAAVALEEGLLAFGQLLPDHLAVANPAVGGGLVFGLDSRWWWRLVSARFVLTSDANAANRFVSVDYCDPEGTAWIRNPAAVVQPAAIAQEYDFAQRALAVSGIAGQPDFAALARSFIPGGWQYRINVANVQVGDQLSAIRLYVEKFEPSTG
jgi:hypothetical protein